MSEMLTNETVARMVDEACTIEKCDDAFPRQCVRDICCHVKALASELEPTSSCCRIDDKPSLRQTACLSHRKRPTPQTK
jgi:hypothetical protein